MILNLKTLYSKLETLNNTNQSIQQTVITKGLSMKTN